jgi:GTP-binding protein
LVVNVVQAKQLTNFREKPSGTSDMLQPALTLSLDDAIQFLGVGDLLEVTPLALRLRKKELKHEVRQRAIKRAKEK